MAGIFSESTVPWDAMPGASRLACGVPPAAISSVVLEPAKLVALAETALMVRWAGHSASWHALDGLRPSDLPLMPCPPSAQPVTAAGGNVTDTLTAGLCAGA